MTRLRSIAVAATMMVAATAAVTVGGGLTPAAPAHAATSGTDDTPPFGGVSGVQSPVAGALTLLLDASDTGLGLANAEASLDERNPAFVRLGTGLCPERPVANPSFEIPVGECPETVAHVPLSLNTTVYPDGAHQCASASPTPPVTPLSS